MNIDDDSENDYSFNRYGIHLFERDEIREESKKRRKKITEFVNQKGLSLFTYAKKVERSDKVLWLITSDDEGIDSETVARLFALQDKAEKCGLPKNCKVHAKRFFTDGEIDGFYQGNDTSKGIVNPSGIHVIPWIRIGGDVIAADTNAAFDVDQLNDTLHILAFKGPNHDSVMRSIVLLYQGSWTFPKE